MPPRDRAAPAALLGAEALALLGVAVAVVVGVGRHGGLTSAGVVSAAFFVLLAALLGLLARGWWQGRAWARTPSGVFQALCLPVGITAALQAHAYAVGVPVLVCAVGGLALVAWASAAGD